MRDHVHGIQKQSPQLAAFSEVLEQHGPALLAFCRAQAGYHRGEDVFQETMLAALRAYDTVREPGALKSWLFSIATRKAVDAHRATERSAVPKADLEPPEPASPPDDEGVWEHVARLPTKQHQAVTLRFMGGLSHREIADVMRISEAAVRRNVFEGLRRLRRELDPNDETEPTTTPARSSR